MGRKRSEHPARVGKRHLAVLAEAYPRSINEEHPRPATRGDCPASGPCPWVSCAYHLAVDVSTETGSITHNWPDREVGELTHTCSLREADRGGLTLEEVGARMNLTRERVRQIELRAFARLRAIAPELVEHLERASDCTGKREYAPPKRHHLVLNFLGSKGATVVSDLGPVGHGASR